MNQTLSGDAYLANSLVLGWYTSGSLAPAADNAPTSLVTRESQSSIVMVFGGSTLMMTGDVGFAAGGGGLCFGTALAEAAGAAVRVPFYNMMIIVKLLNMIVPAPVHQRATKLPCQVSKQAARNRAESSHLQTTLVGFQTGRNGFKPVQYPFHA